jgi:uncharacterized membrane protein YjjB (DUF3815 family)
MLGSIRNGDENFIFCYGAISEAAINLIQPGYWITNACLELMNRQIATSGARLMYALVYALLLAYGVSVGSALYGTFHLDAVNDPVCKDPISPFWNLFFVPFFSIQVGILSGATWKQLPPIVFLTFSMYCAFFFTDRATKSFTLAATAGGLVLGLLGNLYGRIGRRIERVFENMFGGGSNGPDPEAGAANYIRRNHLGFTCAAAAMVPGMIVVVPSGLANRGDDYAECDCGGVSECQARCHAGGDADISQCSADWAFHFGGLVDWGVVRVSVWKETELGNELVKSPSWTFSLLRFLPKYYIRLRSLLV